MKRVRGGKVRKRVRWEGEEEGEGGGKVGRGR